MEHNIERRLLRRVGLHMVEAKDLSIRRLGCGRGFSYRDGQGRIITDAAVRRRIADLVIPPAWREVRIAEHPEAHLQAVGRDEAGRLQYIYHPAWDQIRAARKVERLRHLGASLPRLRAMFLDDLEAEPLSRRAMLAAAAILVDRLILRAGHEAYAGDEGGRGAATLLKRHVALNGDEVRLVFRSKGGRQVDASLADRRLAEVLAQLKKVRGTRLFKERNGRGERPITAEDLNEYLRQTSGQDITAKDFRTFHASVLALELLCSAGPATTARQRRKCLTAVAKEIGAVLHNTPTVARSSYIHPAVIERFECGRLNAGLLKPRCRQGLTAAESALMRLLEESGKKRRNGRADPGRAASRKSKAPPVAGRGRVDDAQATIMPPRG